MGADRIVYALYGLRRGDRGCGGNQRTRDPVLTKDALDSHVVGKGFCSETADIFLRLSDPRTRERRTFDFPDRNNVP